MNQTRLARASIAAVVATVVAFAFHISGGGATSGPALAVTFIGTLWLSVMLAGRAWGTAALTLIVGTSQFAMHWLMSFMPTRSSGTGALIESSHLYHDHALTAVSHMSGGNAMIGAHVCATVVTVAIFRWGEKLLATLLAEVAGVAISFVTWVRPAVESARATVNGALPVVTSQMTAHATQPRAPPVSS